MTTSSGPAVRPWRWYVPARGDKRLTILRRAVGRPALTLICVPFAGGNPEVFCPWAQWLDPGIDLLAVRLPGHGPRMREAPFGTWGELVDDTIDALAPFLSRPHAFYGHCFGGRLAYELAHRAHTAMTARLFIAACRSPDTPPADARVYELPDADFCSALARMGMAPAEVLGNVALMRILLPGIRSQIRLAELWGDRHDAIVDVPITAMYGQEDLTSERQSMTGWPGFTTRGCEFVEIPGGHFFLQENPPLLRDIINLRLAVRPGSA
jgi:medium-chain acyl-[acyl-carrier-protein] hydrolase